MLIRRYPIRASIDDLARISLFSKMVSRMVFAGRYMKILAILTLVALAVVVWACGNNLPPNTVEPTTSGNWEAQLVGGTGPASQLNFVTTFSVINISGGAAVPLDITGISFFNNSAGACFSVGTNSAIANGTATITVQSNGQATGNMSFGITSGAVNGVAAGNSLTLTSLPNGFTGNFTGTTPTAGNISNGVVVGSWTLAGPCTSGMTPAPTGTFVMCQGTTTCSPPGSAR